MGAELREGAGTPQREPPHPRIPAEDGGNESETPEGLEKGPEDAGVGGARRGSSGKSGGKGGRSDKGQRRRKLTENLIPAEISLR